MANYIINTRDIPGLENQLTLLQDINKKITIGPLDVVNLNVLKTLDIGYDYDPPQIDYSYNLNVNMNARIGNNIDVSNNLNVMNNGYIQKLLVYNLQNNEHQYQQIYQGDDSGSGVNPGNMYVYIDTNFTVYPAH